VTGTLAPKFEVDVKSEVTGLVSEVFVTEWVRVKKGDPLARIDVREIEAAVKRAEAALEAAKAAELQARVSDNRSRRELARVRELKEAGLATRQGLEDAGTEAEAAASRVEAARAQVRAVEEELRQVQTRLAKGLIVAPLAGIVSERRANVGDLVGEAGANFPLFHIVDNRILTLTVTVPSAAMAGLRPGQPLEFTTDALPARTFRGKVMFINPAVNAADRSVRVNAEVDNAPGELKGGLFVKGRIVTGSRAGALLVPREALTGWDVLGRKARLFVVAGDRAAGREVRTGLVTEGGVEIVAGLAAGETYIVRGAFNVKEGDRVTVARKKGG
jgi:RND family efflux transporter MFP subunit